MNRLMSRLAGYLAASAVLLVAWWLTALVVHSPALPSPVAAITAFGAAFTADLLPNLGVSTWRVVVSLAIGLGLGAPVGLALGRSEKLDTVFAPLVYVTYPVPKVVFLPVLLVLLGIGDAPKIALIAIILFFQVLVTARDAARSVPASAILSARSLGAGRLDLIRHVVVPATLPEIFTALRISVGTAIAVLFFSETIAGTSGLGWYILDAWSRIAYPDMFAGIIAMALLGVALYEVIEFAEARLCRWTRAGS